MKRKTSASAGGFEENAGAPFENEHADIARARVAFAMDRLERRGALSGRRSARLSVRVDPGLIAAARARIGAGSDSEVVTAALALLGIQDDYGAWLVSRADPLPEDFELEFFK